MVNESRAKYLSSRHTRTLLSVLKKREQAEPYNVCGIKTIYACVCEDLICDRDDRGVHDVCRVTQVAEDGLLMRRRGM